MNAEPIARRVLLYSPWFLLAFLLIPATVIISLLLHLNLPVLSARLLLINNVCFGVVVACRFAWYLTRARKEIRYGAAHGRPAGGFAAAVSCPEARKKLSGAGFVFAPADSYGEKRDAGYLGTVVLYGGLLIMLGAGSWDNLNQFAGTLLDGVGPATKLSDLKSYRVLNRGPLASRPKSLPDMRILNQILPDSTYLKGATEVAFFRENTEPVQTVLVPGTPYRWGSYDIYMSKLVFEPELVIKDKNSRVLFDSFVKLDPLVQKRGDFSFYGPFAGRELVGGAYYQPEKNLLMLVVTRNGKRVVADMQFQVDQQITAGDYVLSCAKMGQWSEIHVVRRRGKGLLILGGVIALAGLVLRLAVRPQRVWLEEGTGGCRVLATGDLAKRLLQAG